jgi:nucleotide-binding universal stress UspA family protein
MITERAARLASQRMPSRIVIAYDGSATAGAAVRVAAALFEDAQAIVATVPSDLAVRTGTVSLVVPTMPPELVQRTIDDLQSDSQAEAERTAREGADRAAALGLDAEAALTHGGAAPWSALLAFAHERGADAIVCGSRGRGAFARALLGSTSTSLLHHADLPLLVVPDGAGGLDGPTVLAYDGSEPSERAIAVAGELLAGRPAVVVHAWHSQYRRGRTAAALARGPVDEVREIVKALDESLEEAANEIAAAGVEHARAAGLDATGEAHEADAGAWRTVATAARSLNAAVIVSGTGGAGGALSALLGSTSSGLIHNAELPVLVVPAE